MRNCLVSVIQLPVRGGVRSKVQKESSTGSTTTNKVKIKLTLSLETIDFDPATCTVRVKGKNTQENEFIKMGAYHTLELELGRSFILEKTHWDSIYLGNDCFALHWLDVNAGWSRRAHRGRLRRAPIGRGGRCRDAPGERETAPARWPDSATCVIQGLAHVCLITSQMTQVRAKIEVNVPKKRVGSTTGHDKVRLNPFDTSRTNPLCEIQAVTKFYEAVMDAIRRHVNFKVVKCCLIASPAYIKVGRLETDESIEISDSVSVGCAQNDFYAYLIAEATKKDLREILENKAKFLLCHAPSGHK